MLRTHTCGELTGKDIGKKVKVAGWVQTRRDHGGVIFIDLRDRYGLTQIVFDPSHNKAVHSSAEHIGREFVLIAEGKVRNRPKDMVNKKMKTGDVEVIVDKLELTKAEVPPIEIEDNIEANEDTRLKFRYLDLRRPKMQKNLMMRHKAAHAAREYLNKQGFIEVETPLLIKSTPEGARDYVVPSRVNPGKFYALPQSPQLYKQILMIAGFDRYYQIARCLRDEDLRQDRQPEHTQIDLEMSFVEQNDVMELVEGCCKHVLQTVTGKKESKPFPIMTYKDAMDKYGSDKPDLRFGMELVDVTDVVKKSDFKVFSGAEQVKCIVAEKDFSRNEIDDLIKWAQENGAKGLAWMKVTSSGLDSSIVKFFSKPIQKQLLQKAKAKKGSVLFFVADKPKVVADVLGKLRVELAQRLKLIDSKEFKFCWVVDFPMFDWNEDEKRWDPTHHPFTMPRSEDIKFLEKDPGKVYAQLYDLVLNGIELGSGSIRINNPELQERVLKVIGIGEKEAESKFGFLLKAYKYGGPIHGGIGWGFDRTVALMLGFNDIREVIAFPKNKKAECPMDGSPSDIDEKQLKELHLKTDVMK
ncbi:aspartate--tRNA ligase [Candidatus Woesearchaeota archaeon]|nr:aspartate--tRNA ligase [Candidatus Woesearchaeota archaeon]|tara:strand:- start:4927 stop:6669 length:1743 start_codon:yes stop_codon:yes gene_type:complete